MKTLYFEQPHSTKKRLLSPEFFGKVPFKPKIKLPQISYKILTNVYRQNYVVYVSVWFK